MARIRTDIDSNDIAKLYESGMTADQIAERFGIRKHLVYQRLKKLGTPMRSPIITLDCEKIIRLFNGGMAVKALALKYGVSRSVITQRLTSAGIALRGRSESMFVRMSHTPPEERIRLTDAAHAAIRGKTRPVEEKCKKALTVERTLSGCISRIEVICADLLKARGFRVIPQKACGPYNIDVALPEQSVAVEIFGGNWHTAGSHATRFRKRFDYLLDSGWLPVIIWVSRDYPLESGAIEYVISLAEQIRCNEPVIRKEHMIRGNGDLYTIRQHCFDNRPAVEGPQSRDNTTGRFTPRIGE